MKNNDALSEVRAIAFYLPQFHPIPENDQWWGKGFTEWTNTTKARPLYDGHYQPRLPADLGFYDLRLEEVRIAQAELAKQYGIHGFCYYYYWFKDGKKLLNQPIEAVLASQKPDFPFCVCWANESWTRRWGGEDGSILMQQDLSTETCTSLIRELAPYFLDPRYIRVNDKPLFLIYRTDEFPDLTASIAAIRDEARRSAGVELYVVCQEARGTGAAEIAAGCDATYEFPNGYRHVQRDKIITDQKHFYAPFSGVVRDYADLANHYLHAPSPPYVRFKGVTLGWDNTARRKNAAIILENFSLTAYHEWLSGCVRSASQKAHRGENLVFINAWNEWGEGSYLEPDDRYGHQYLEATAAALKGQMLSPDTVQVPPLPAVATVVSGVSNSDAIPHNKAALFSYIPNLWQESASAEAFNQSRYYEKPRTELFKAIANPGRAMLDVGCGAGATSAELKKTFPETQFFGIELQPEMAAVAEQKLDRVISGNFESIDFSEVFSDGETFDTILFADVLEHMYNPWQALKRTDALLAAGGKIVASVPNIFNLQLIDNLCQGNWSYQHYGLLDFTHLRFFTLSTLTEMFRETGYKVSGIYGLPLPKSWMPHAGRDSLGHFSTASMSFKKIDDMQIRQLSCLQYVIVAHK